MSCWGEAGPIVGGSGAQIFTCRSSCPCVLIGFIILASLLKGDSNTSTYSCTQVFPYWHVYGGKTLLIPPGGC